MSEIIHTRLNKKTKENLDQLARARGSTRSAEIRKAVKIYLADYTGEPDIDNIEKRLRIVEGKINVLEAKHSDLRS